MKKLFLISLSILACMHAFGQGLRADGKQIVNKNGEEVLLRGVGPGGWQIMEGYMMQTSGVAGSQHEIKEKLIELMGEANTATFYNKWRTNHFTQRDVDSLAAWGFNSIRVPMHYNLFTLPIEQEPVAGEHTWYETGFQLIDNLLEWCAPYDMYVILDLHAAPGGQGTGSEINDYDPDKPSLWESQANKDKTVALWTRIAERYKDNEWIGGYDLINEPHWSLPGGNDLRKLYIDITNGIRSVDAKHILFIEGNWYANDFTGLTPPWDDNMVYSFHKYWSFNNENDLDWVLPLREQHDIPLWMGESGENSNTWFTDAVTLFENNNIGWAWWTMRKIGDIDSPYAVEINPGYQKIIDYWKGTGPKPTSQEAFDGMMQLAENLLVENSQYRKDVPDALIRQVQTDATIPYARHVLPGIVYTSDFDLGKNEYAYFDHDVADYNLSTGSFQAWNSGWSYRNDGVDVETNDDNVNSNGYNIGFSSKGEWVKYTVQIIESGVYNVDMRVATDIPNGGLHLSLDDQSITSSVAVSQTGGWKNFSTHTIQNVILEEGEHALKLHFDDGAINVSSLAFTKISDSDDSVPFTALTADAGGDEQSIILSLSKEIQTSSSPLITDFSVTVNGQTMEIAEVTIDPSLNRSIVILLAKPLANTDDIKLSYTGTSISSTMNNVLNTFSNMVVFNNLKPRYAIPWRIEAEGWDKQVGLRTEETTDTGGGLNIGYTDYGDYADYKILVREEGNYSMNLRVASDNQSGKVGFYMLNEAEEETELITVDLPVTGGWQTWETINTAIDLPTGKLLLRLKVLRAGFNMNWFEMDHIIASSEEPNNTKTFIYPNPSNGTIHISDVTSIKYELITTSGTVIATGAVPSSGTITIGSQKSGLYILRLLNNIGQGSFHKLYLDNGQ